MGVIYKLTDKVKGFIIAQKKAQPNLSCRSLGKLAQKRFNLSISKSSINQIIKQTGLSSPVGRRLKLPRSLLKKQPTILKPEAETLAQVVAQEKKELLLPVEGKLTIIPQPKQVEKPVVPQAEEEKKLEVPPPQPIEIKEDKEKIPVLLRADVSQVIEVKEDEIVDNLGFFFVKAAEWGFSQRSILAEIIKPSLSLSSYDPQELEIKAEILLYLFAFGFQDLEAIKSYQGKGVWVINQAKPQQAQTSLPEFVQELKRIKGFTLAVLGSTQQFFSQVNYFKLILADNTVLYFDGQFRTIWQDANIPQIMSSTLYKSRVYVKEFFQNNVQSANILTVPGYLSFSNAFYEFLYACEDFPQKRMLRVSLHSQDKYEISSPLKLPPLKRYFMMGFWPWQQEGSRFIQEDIRIVKSFFLKDFAKEIFYSEMKVNLPQYQSFQGVKIRLSLLRDTGLSWPKMGILTNLPDAKPMEEVIADYLKRWPNLDEGYQDFLKKSERSAYLAPKAASSFASKEAFSVEPVYSLSGEKMDLWQNLGYLVTQLSNFSQRYFFPREYENADFSMLKQRFYGLPGQIKRRENSLFITLLPPAGYAFQKELVYAARRLNESHIQDPLGNKLCLKIR